MPGKHKEPTIAFRPSAWARAIIEQRATLSGIYKKDFITRSCVYSNIVMVGKKENIQRIVDSLQEMQIVMKEIAGQVQFSVRGKLSGVKKGLSGTCDNSCGYRGRGSISV